MKVLGKDKIDHFKKKHSSQRRALDRFVKLLENSNFKTPQEVKNLFGVNVDFVGNQVVFDVAGNKIRAITRIEYGIQIIIVTYVLTHEEYDRDKWRD